MAKINYQKMLSDAYTQHSQVLSGIDRNLVFQRRAQQRTAGGYNKLTSNVLGGLAGAGEARSQQIADFYTNKLGGSEQDLLSRGLGNSTVLAGVRRGFALDQSKAQTDLANQLATEAAGYKTKIGLAGLDYRGNAINQNSALMQSRAGHQADWSRALLGAGMQGAGLEQQYELSTMNNRLGGGSGGGGAASSGAYERWHNQDRSTPSYRSDDRDPLIDLNAGLYGPGGGGAPPPRQQPAGKSNPISMYYDDVDLGGMNAGGGDILSNYDWEGYGQSSY